MPSEDDRRTGQTVQDHADQNISLKYNSKFFNFFCKTVNDKVIEVMR